MNLGVGELVGRGTLLVPTMTTFVFYFFFRVIGLIYASGAQESKEVNF